MHLPEPLQALLTNIHSAGGRGWLVGGSVRDHLLGRQPKDLDVEVHGLDAGALQAILSPLGRVKAVGRSFGVFKLRIGRDEYDVSLPQPGRARTAQGEPVVIAGDPHMGITEALRRRDLTINAIAYDPLNGEYADPFGGRADLSRGLLRAVDDETFSDDPLRVLRVMQFAGRFGFSADPGLAALCRSLPIGDLPAERLLTEFEKLLLKSPRPSAGLVAARAADIFGRLLPALAAADGPELAAALDRAATLRRQHAPPLALMFSTLLHRCTVAEATAVLDRLKVFTQGGYPLRKRIVHAVGAWQQLAAPIEDVGLRWLAEGGEVALVARVAWAATGAQVALDGLERAGGLGIAQRPLPPLIKGRDLGEEGIPPGPWMGALLRGVRAAQLDGNICDKAGAIELAMRLWREQSNGGAG